MAMCPWPEVEVGGHKPNFYNCKNHGPGWEEPLTKPKRPLTEVSPGLVDIRPKHKRPRVRKTATLKGKEQEMDLEAT